MKSNAANDLLIIMSLIFPLLINQRCPRALGLRMRGADLDAALGRGWAGARSPSFPGSSLDSSTLGDKPLGNECRLEKLRGAKGEGHHGE